ncbi:MAG: hypothetical protein L0Z50_23255 [Verrucomicrobiales bacterium]|nr:hypothetical protein [Verrucomicrobiales bacterium]
MNGWKHNPAIGAQNLAHGNPGKPGKQERPARQVPRSPRLKDKILDGAEAEVEERTVLR